MKCRRKGIQRCFFGPSDFSAFRWRVGGTLPVEFLELQAWWAADSPWIPMAVLTGPMPARLIHWRALIKARVVWGPLSPLTPAHRPVQQQWALGFWTGLLSATQTLWEYVAGVKALTVDVFLFVSHRNSVAPTTPWVLPSLWWTSSASASPTMACEVCGLCLGADFPILRCLYKLDWCFWAVLCVVSTVFQS